MARPVEIEITGDSRKAEAAFDRTARSARRFSGEIDSTGRKLDQQSRRLSSFAKGAAAGFVGAEVFNLVTTQAKAAIDVASNLNEQIARSNVVFGESATEIEAWAQSAATSMGLAEDKAIEAAATFGSMFAQAGQSKQDAASLSEAVVQLAGDLASFGNTSVDEALTALRSGLSGEIEPLRRFTVFLTEASVQQQAMADTGKTNARQLTQGEKIMARWKLILQQTGAQQGDFLRTSDGLANKQRTLAAEARNLQGELGKGLLPIMESLVDVTQDAVEWTLKLTDALGGLERNSDHVTLGDLFVNITEIPDVIRKSLKPPWEWKDVAESQAQALTDEMKTALQNVMAGQTFGIDPIRLPRDVSASAAQSNREALAEARGDLQGVLAIQTRRRDDLKRMLDNAKQLGWAQKKIDDYAKRYTAAQIAVIGTQKQIAANDKALRAAAESSARDAKATADANAAAARERAREAREAQAAAEQRRQFRLIGLSPEGEKPTPTPDNLRKQAAAIRARIKAGDTIPAELLRRLPTVEKALTGGIKNMTEETRKAIAEFFATIRGEWQKGEKSTDDLLKPFATAGLNTNAVVAGLGLTAAQNRRLRARLAGATTARKQLAPTAGTVGAYGLPIETTVYLDGQVVGRSTKRYLSNDSLRAPMQKRGMHAGRG